jgi:hypothetical protein
MTSGRYEETQKKQPTGTVRNICALKAKTDKRKKGCASKGNAGIRSNVKMTSVKKAKKPVGGGKMER